SVFYVAKLGGFLDKNGIDADLQTGPTGGGMIPLVVSNQANAAMAAEVAGINNHLIDGNVVVVAQGVRYDRWWGIVVSKDVQNVADLRTRKIGIARGTASEGLWFEVLKQAKLNAAEFNASMVDVEPPEMVAA